jgi:hypothetical protein
MSHLASALGVTFLIVTIAAAARGEEAPHAPRVRVRAPAVQKKPFVGRLVGMDEDALRIERPHFKEGKNTVVVVPRSSVTRFEVSRRQSLKGRGALVGALLGAGAGVLIVAGGEDEWIASCPPPPGWGVVGRGQPYPCSPEGSGGRWAAAILAVPAGALLGALVSPGEQWEASDPASLRVVAAPASGGGAQVRLILSF